MTLKKGNCEPLYRESVSWLYSLQRFGIKFGLSKTSNLLRAFGSPHEGQKYIHIAGTNGKGSVGAMLVSVLMKSGLKVGFYSSPHLVSFTERFRINNGFIRKEEADQLIREVRGAASKKDPPTFFEMTTAMALVYFARSKVDVAVIEVGMGGRLDATNIIRPLISVITNISREHREFLGKKITDIAREKAGIIKPGVDLATAVSQPGVIGMLKSLCQEKKTLFWRVGADVRYRRLAPGVMNYCGLKHQFQRLSLGVGGGFQYRNAALALLVLELLEEKGVGFSREAITQGFSDLLWPGRLEKLSSEPTIILDGAHNPFAMRSLARSIKEDFQFHQMILVLGIMADKDIRGMIREILPLADRVIYTRPAYYRAADPGYLMDTAGVCGKPGEVYLSVREAIDRARSLAGKKDLVLITGSLFTVGEAKTYFDPISYPAEDI